MSDGGSAENIARQVALLSQLARRGFATVQRAAHVGHQAAQLSFVDWVSAGNFLADRERVDFSTWRYLRPIYAAVPDDPAGLDLVIMKSAQGGASIFALLAALWLAMRGRCQLAYFLPTADLARTFSSTRFLKIARDNAAVHSAMGDPADPRSRRMADEGSANTRQIGPSLVHFTHLAGRITTEAMPLDALIFDEVQEMSLTDIEKAEERLSASALQTILRLSTATLPGTTIDFFYSDSDQREFHTRCACPDGVVLADAWDPQNGPLCIGQGNGLAAGVPRQPFFVCPRCNTIIKDPQDGAFIAHNPGADRTGFHFPQMLSPRSSAAKIYSKWQNRISTQNFYNRVLGRPYADPSTIPVRQHHLEACQDSTLRWGPPRESGVDAVCMGIDQMGGENYVVIKARRDGQMHLVHLEVVQSDDPWKRCADLLREFSVTVAAVENAPNFNEAHRFAKAHDGRVFVISYATQSDEMVLWGDRPRDSPAVRYTSEDVRTRHTANVDQFKMMSWSLGRIAQGELRTPDARSLVQHYHDGRLGTRQVAVCRDLFWLHLQSVALVTEPVEGHEDERRFRSAVKKLRIDPHFAYANMLCDVAWVRDGVRSTFLFPTAPEPEAKRSPYAEQLRALMPHAFLQTYPELVCGTCQHFAARGSRCELRDFVVQPDQPCCDFYLPNDTVDD